MILIHVFQQLKNGLFIEKSCNVYYFIPNIKRQLGVESNWNSFEIRSIRKFAIDPKRQKIFEKFNEN